MTVGISPLDLLIIGLVLIGSLIAVWLYTRQRLRLVERLQRNQAVYRTMYLNLPLPVIVLDPDGTVRVWNTAAEKTFGWTEHEIAGRPLPIVGEAQQDEYRSMTERVLRERSFVGVEVRRMTKSGSTIKLSLSAATITDEKNRVAGLIHIYENITKRKEVEEAIQESELIYRELFIEVERQTRELSLLDKVRAEIASELELPALFRKVVAAVADTYGYTQVSLYWREGDISVLQHQVGYAKVLDRIPIDRGVSSRVYRTGQPVLVEDVGQEPDFLETINGLVSELCVPLLDQGEVVGFFNVESTNDMRLGQADLRLMTALSQHVNVAIERGRLYTQIRQSEERYRAIVQDQTELICRFSADLKHTFVNEAYCRFYDKKREEIIGRDFLALPLITPAENDRLAAYFRKLEETRSPSSDEQRLVMPDGEIRWLLWTDHPIYDENGHLIEFQSVGRDITERKKAETTEREGRIFSEALHDASTAITSTLDLQTVMLRILESVERVVPHDASSIDLIERGSAHIAYWRNYPPDSEKYLREEAAPLDSLPIAQQIRATGQSYLVSDTNTDQNWVVLPELEWIRSHISAPMQVHGNIVGILNLDSATPGFFTAAHLERLQIFADQAAVALDNARLYERIRQHAAELEQHVADRTMELTVANVRLLELDRLKRKFIADVSHELRTPLSTLNLRLYLMEHDTPEKVGEHLTVLKKEFVRLKELLDGILTFSQDKLTADTQGYLEPVNLNEIIEDVIETYRPRAEVADLNLIFTPAENLPMILGQISAFVQVVANLLTNALNYTTVGNVIVGTYCDPAQERVCLEVKDTGMGIAPEDLPHLFERFYRGQRVGSMNIPGMGLGLTTVKEIVDSYQGKIEIESQVDQGSTFRVWFPTILPGQTVMV